jgi:[ribosomal protein S5]-alanine N-acetyltransferase
MSEGIGSAVRSMFTWLTPISQRETVELVGDRVLLRPLALSDADEMFTFVSDPEVTRFLPWDPAPNVETVQNFLQEQVGRRKRGDSLGFAMIQKETGRMIGSTDLMELKTIKGQAELGYLLARSCWGQGIMTEAALLTAGYAFRALNVGRLSAWADQENRASRRVMEKLGMHLAGTELRIVKNESRPYVRYEILRSVWEINH